MRAHRLQDVNRAGRREPAARSGSEQKCLRRRKRQLIGAHHENQYVLNGVHGLVFEQLRALQCSEKILFHPSKIFLGNRVARDQDQFHGRRQFMLMQTETFAEQSPGAATGGRIADFFAGDHPDFGRRAIGQAVPIGDETAEHQSFAALTHTRKIAVLREPRRAAQTQAFRRRGVHNLKPASGACGHCDDGWPGWLCRSWWSYG